MCAADNCCFCPSPRATFPHRQTRVSPGPAQQEERPPSAPAHCVLHTKPEGVTVLTPCAKPSSALCLPVLRVTSGRATGPCPILPHILHLCLLPIACPTDIPASSCLKTFDLSVLGKTDIPHTHTLFFPSFFLRQSHCGAPTYCWPQASGSFLWGERHMPLGQCHLFLF